MNIELTKWSKANFEATTLGGVDDGDFLLGKQHAFRVALLIPMCGAAGLWAPSCIASAQVAVNELNQATGIAGRQVQMIMIDSALEAHTPVEELVNSLIETGSIDAIVGMHISAIRQRLVKIVNSRVPYIYTPLYEGGECTPGVFTIGDTPPAQLGRAMERLQRDFKLRSWAMIGNDYVWPRASNSYAKTKLQEMGGNLVYEQYLPFGAGDLSTHIEAIAGSGADAVLMSLVGQDAVDFNRLFGAYGLDRNMIRLSCALEENALLASGAENLKRLFSSASYFASVDTLENAVFREKYHGFHGDRAPVLNAIGQSTYEGMQFLASLMGRPKSDWRQRRFSVGNPIEYKSVRKAKYGSNAFNGAPIYLARANGVLFDDIKVLV
jgi:ABC-type branched-subunit amino acid transport system substrate-binding protein